MWRTRSSVCRCGVTLLELLVVIAIIGALTTLLLPALEATRESARRTQCLSRLRQLGIALHGYHGLHQAFPPGFRNGWSWHTQILPQLEREHVYQRYDFRRLPLEPPNSMGLDTILPELLCPSDPNGDNVHTAGMLNGLRFAHTNYLGSLANGASRGMFSHQGVRIADVIDGTSRTLFAGERGIVFDGVNTHGWWTWGPATSIAPVQPFHEGSYEDPAAIMHWWSYHSGGANFLFVDGSVRFLPYDTNAKAFAALGTRDGAEVERLPEPG